jgi:hypothetical protein
MSIECAFSGSLVRDAETKTSKAGKQYVRINVRVENGEAAQFINTMVFDTAVPVSELELILADARREAMLEIEGRVDRHVALDDVRDLASRGFPTDADERDGA